MIDFEQLDKIMSREEFKETEVQGTPKMCVWRYARTYLCRCLPTNACMFACVSVFLCVCAYVCGGGAGVQMCTYVRANVRICVCVCIRACR